MITRVLTSEEIQRFQQLPTREEKNRLFPALLETRLQVGDIVLTRHGRFTGSFIARVTQGGASAGGYSHAALWINEAGTHQLIRTGRPGGSITRLGESLIRLRNGQWLRTRAFAARPAAIEVRRHPGFRSLDKDRIEWANRAFRADLAQRGHVHDGGSMQGESERPVRPELVAKYFEKLGLALFRDGTSPAAVTPDCLTQENCLLEKVDDALLLKEQDLPDEITWVSRIGEAERRGVLPRHVGERPWMERAIHVGSLGLVRSKAVPKRRADTDYGRIKPEPDKFTVQIAEQTRGVQMYREVICRRLRISHRRADQIAFKRWRRRLSDSFVIDHLSSELTRLFASLASTAMTETGAARTERQSKLSHLSNERGSALRRYLRGVTRGDYYEQLRNSRRERTALQEENRELRAHRRSLLIEWRSRRMPTSIDPATSSVSPETQDFVARVFASAEAVAKVKVTAIVAQLAQESRGPGRNHHH